MKLYIAEKPSLGRAIAAVLPKPHKKQDGYIEAANGDCVSWCIGHLLEQADPEAYDPMLKKWQLDSLPIIPDQWQLKPKPQTRKQLTVLRQLVKKATQLVNAGDPDREGQLLVDEVISYLKPPVHKIQNAQRVLISDLTPAAVKKALANPRANRDFIPLATSALARSRADWLYGINLTRAFTLKGQQAGYQGVLSVGRVQTPILGLVARRDEEIENFQPKAFFEVLAHIQPTKNDPLSFTAKWQPSEACLPHQDEEGRVLNPKLTEHVVARIHQQPANVIRLDEKQKTEAPPLPFNLSQLQITASKAFGLSAQQVLDTCQSLYERHNLVTYPRSDSRYLPTEQWGDRHQVLSAISHNLGSKNPNSEHPAAFVPQADPTLKSKAWNNSKVDAHHAIIPTGKQSDISRLSATEQKVYRLIAQYYLAQFFPAYRYLAITAEFEINGGSFIAHARQNQELGWKPLLKQQPEEQHLPAFKQGDSLWCSHGEQQSKQTQPPKTFTEGTLLSAMTGISRFVKDKAIRRILKETDGLGTEATRAGIIELLIKRGFIRREGKSVLSTDSGRALIRNLPESTTLPDRTAQWESQLEAISQKERRYQDFMQPMLDDLTSLVDQAKSMQMSGLAGLKGSGGFKKRRKGSGQGRSQSQSQTSGKTKTTARKKLSGRRASQA